MNNTNNHSSSFVFSVVVAVYNVAPFLESAIDSVIAQDFGFEKIQLILVNDGSTDGSGTICDRYQKKYPENIVVIHKENGGVASARNEGLKYASGHYINFMDSDDYFTKNVFSTVYAFYRLHEEETDIITIPLEFFDAVTGDHWQNYKFKKGSRIIDLHEEYTATLMFTNASFYHNRVKDRIYFDSHLVCGEDMKVNLEILSEKMKLGVVVGCKYMYRRRSVGEASLIAGAKRKYGWYFDYFTYLVDWAVSFYQNKFGFLPAFVQYILLCDIQWRYKQTYDMESVLTPDEILAYKQRIADTLRYFDDKYIMEQRVCFSEHKCYILSQKYGVPPTLTPRGNDFLVHFGNTNVTSLSTQTIKLEHMRIEDQGFEVEGFTNVVGPGLDEPIEVYIRLNDVMIPCEDCTGDEDLNEYRFSDLLFRKIKFRVQVSLPNECDHTTVKFYVKYRNTFVEKRNLKYGSEFPLAKNNQTSTYYWPAGKVIQLHNNALTIFSCSKTKYLINEIKKNCKKRIRPVYRALRALLKGN